MANHSSGRWACGVLAVWVLLTVSAPGQAPTPDRTRVESASRRVADRISVLQRESDALASQETSLLIDLRRLDVERQLRTAELERAAIDLGTTRAALAATVARADALRKAADTERPDIEARLVRLYTMGRAGYWRLLLDVDDLRSMGRAYRTASALTRIDRDRIQQHTRTIEQLDREGASLEVRAREVATLQERAARASRDIERAVASRTALVDSIDARRDLNAQLTGELEAAQQKLQSAVGQLASGRPLSVSLPIRPFRGTLGWPVQGIVIGLFGRPQTGFGAGITRNGIEVSVAEGQPVRAIHDGTVAFSEQFTGYGNLVIVDHGDGAYSLYGHLASLDVPRGAQVAAQDRVGTSGRNPAGNPSLYFEVRIDGKPVDPLQWLKRQP